MFHGAVFTKRAPLAAGGKKLSPILGNDRLEPVHLFFEEFPGFCQFIQFVLDIGSAVQRNSAVGLDV